MIDRRRFLAGAAATLGTAGCLIPRGGGTKFRFASWNVGHFALGRSRLATLKRSEALTKSAVYRAFLDEVAADVLGVCEFGYDFSDDGYVVSTEAVFPRYARHNVGPAYHYQWNAHFWNGHECRGTAVREYERHNQASYYIMTRLSIGGTPVTFVETHLDWDIMRDGHADDRADQMRTLIADFGGEDRVVIAGDFNVGVRFADKSRKPLDNPSEYGVFERAGFTVGNDGRFKTWPSGACEYALDNIIVKGLRLSDFRVWDRPDLSDHALVSAELEII